MLWKNAMFLLALLLVLPCLPCFSLQGSWRLVRAKGIDLSKQSITLTVEEYIFKKSQILQKLTISGCRVMLLQAEASNDQLFINFNSYSAKPLPNVTCERDNAQDQLYAVLSTVFSFQISNDSLQMSDPYHNTILTFKRLVPSQSKGIAGVWNLLQFGSTKSSLSVEVSDKQISLCQGNLILNYTVKERNVITLTPVLSTCPSKNLTNAFLNSKYIRAYNGTVRLFDSSVALTAELLFSAPYDPTKPLFPPAAPNATTKTPPPAPPAAPLPSPISTGNLVGKWSIQSLFNIPFPSTPYSITFTPSALQLSGGCGNYSFSYTINNASQLISIGNSTPISKGCSQSDDQLYASGVSKMYKYLLSSTNGLYSLKFYDQSGAAVYALQINQKTAAKTVAVAVPVAAPPPPLTPGKYLLLLLQRRDLPRVLVNVTGNMLTYKVCNTIQQIYLPSKLSSSNSTISFTGGATTNSTCKVNNDEIYFGTLNLARSYTYDADASSVVVSNAGGVEIATLTQSG